MLKNNTEIKKWTYSDTFEYDGEKVAPQFIIKGAYVRSAIEKFGTVVLDITSVDTNLLNKFNAALDVPLNKNNLTMRPDIKILRHVFSTLKVGDCVNCCIEYVGVTKYNDKLYNKYELKAFKFEQPAVEMDIEDL